MISLAWSLLFVVLRTLLVVGVFRRGAGLPLFFGLSESLALLTTLYSLRFGRRDISLAGLLCPLCYLAPLLFNFSQHLGPGWAADVYLCCVPMLWALRLRLGLCCTVGAPCLTTIVCQFPYSVIRHPLAAVECLACYFVAMWCGTFSALLIWLIVVVTSVFAVLVEERFLMNVSPFYRAYSEAIPWRFLPYIF